MLCVRPLLLCYSKVLECAVFALCQTIVIVLHQGAGVCSVCSVSDHCCVTARCRSVQCLLCVRPLLLCYSKVLECAVFGLFQTIFVALQQGAGVCSVCSVSDHCCCVTARCWSVQCLLCLGPFLLCYSKVLECAVFALCQTIVVVLQQGAGVCSVCSVSDHCCVTTRCWSVQCLLCVRPLLLCYSKCGSVRCLLCVRPLLLCYSKCGSVRCLLCVRPLLLCYSKCRSVQCLLCVRPLLLCYSKCGSVQCLLCVKPLLCYNKVLECAVFALCQTIVVVLQQGVGVCSVCSVSNHCCCVTASAGVCSVCSVSDHCCCVTASAGVCGVCSVSNHCCCVTARCGSVQCLLCVRSLLLCYSKVRECAVFALCQLLSARSMSTRLEVLKKIGNFYHREVEKHDYLQLTDVLTLHVFERSLQDFTLSLVAGIRREGTVTGVGMCGMGRACMGWRCVGWGCVGWGGHV